jgi:hypothetical protein
MTVNSAKFNPLLGVILTLASGRYDFFVKADAVAQRLGGNQTCNKLGWVTFTTYIGSAAQAKYIAIQGTGTDKMIAAKAAHSPTPTGQPTTPLAKPTSTPAHSTSLLPKMSLLPKSSELSTLTAVDSEPFTLNSVSSTLSPIPKSSNLVSSMTETPSQTMQPEKASIEHTIKVSCCNDYERANINQLFDE